MSNCLQVLLNFGILVAWEPRPEASVLYLCSLLNSEESCTDYVLLQDGSSELGAGEENGKRAIRARQGFQDGSSELGAGESNGKRAIGARQGFQDGSSELGATENGKQR